MKVTCEAKLIFSSGGGTCGSGIHVFFIRTLKMELGLMFLAYQGFVALKCS